MKITYLAVALLIFLQNTNYAHAQETITLMQREFLKNRDNKLQRKLYDWLQNQQFGGPIGVYGDKEASELFVIEDHVQSALVALTADPDVGEKASYLLHAYYPEMSVIVKDGKPTLAQSTSRRVFYPWKITAAKDLRLAVQKALDPLEKNSSLEMIKNGKAKIKIVQNRDKTRSLILARYSENPLNYISYYLVFIKKDGDWLLVDFGLKSFS